MQLKQYVRYEMFFSGKWANVCMGSIGISFFLRVLYYFGIVNLMDIGGGEIFFNLILPLFVFGVYIALFRVVKWNAPGIYAIVGCVICLMLMIWNFSSGDFLRIFLSVLFYIAASVLLLGTAGGYLPSKAIVSIVIGLILFFRVLLYWKGQDGIPAYITEVSSVFMLISLLALTFCFKVREKQ